MQGWRVLIRTLSNVNCLFAPAFDDESHRLVGLLVALPPLPSRKGTQGHREGDSGVGTSLESQYDLLSQIGETIWQASESNCRLSMRNVCHVFLIEDNAGDILLIRSILREQGIPIRVHVARDGAEAMFMLAEGRFKPDLILLDLNLPRISGN